MTESQSNRDIRKRCEICQRVTIKTSERRHWRRSGVFIVNFEHISHLFLVFLLLTLNNVLDWFTEKRRPKKVLQTFGKVVDFEHWIGLVYRKEETNESTPKHLARLVLVWECNCLLRSSSIFFLSRTTMLFLPCLLHRVWYEYFAGLLASLHQTSLLLERAKCKEAPVRQSATKFYHFIT